MDINFFDDRLSTTIEYSKEHRWDILLQDEQRHMLGFTTPYSNLGEVKTGDGIITEMEW